jgi:hypothetical protein
VYDEMAEMQVLGRANLEAVELIREHCRHARVWMPHGNSTTGQLTGMPLAAMEVRCEHAAPTNRQSINLIEIAVDYYRDRCVGCEQRDGTGVVPNLKTEVDKHDAELEQRRQREEERTERIAARRAARRRRRRLLVAGEAYVVRELADAIDRLDTDDRGEGTQGDVEACRELVQSARWAPALFSPALVASVLEMAVDTGEPAGFEALAALVRAGRCDARRAVEAALTVLETAGVNEAADLLADFSGSVRSQDLPPVLDRLVELAAGKDLITVTVPAAPRGFLAAAAVDLPRVTDDLIERLKSADDQIRADGAAAAEQLLQADSASLVVLGAALISACRDDGMFYAGQPHPSTRAAHALAAGWRADPATCVAMIETAAAGDASVDRVGLMRVINAMSRDGLTELSAEAADAVVQFCLARLRGDWGERAAAMAIEELNHAADEITDLLEPRVHTLLGILIESAVPHPSALASPDVDTAHPGADFELVARRLSVARLLGHLARRSGAAILEPIVAVFTADSGDEQQDLAIRTALLTALTEAATVAALRDLLPIVYAGLLSPQPQLRAQAIELWSRCAEISRDAVPANLADLAEVLLADEYVVVHQTMLRRIGGLGVPGHLIPRLLTIAAGWARTYADRPDRLSGVARALWQLARQLDDAELTHDWQSVVLDLVPRLDPHDREDLLTLPWPEALRDSASWHTCALGALAEPELTDGGWPRRDPLLAELLERPARLTDVSLPAFIKAGDAHLPGIAWRALEFAELLQAVGRHADCVSLARHVSGQAPSGAEGAPDRQLADVVAAIAQLDDMLAASDVTTAGAIATEIAAAEDAVAVIAAQVADEHPDDRAILAGLIDVVTARTQVLRALLSPVSANPAVIAGSLEQAADQLEAAAGHCHATALQRRRVAQAWRIAATLARWDGALRTADRGAAGVLWQSAQRQNEVLTAEVAEFAFIPVPAGLLEFCRTVAGLQPITEMSAALRHLVRASAPVRMANLHNRTARRVVEHLDEPDEASLAVCVASFQSSPITDVFVAQPNEAYPIGMTVRLPEWPEWAQQCVVAPVSTIGREALTLPVYAFTPGDVVADDGGILLSGVSHMICRVQQPIHGPAIDCPVTVQFIGETQDKVVTVAGYRRLRLRPFDPARDRFTEHPQTDQRLLAMYDALIDAAFDVGDVRAFCTFFSACVTAGQSIMFDKTFRLGTRVTEAQFHDELERRLRDDQTLGGRLTRRDAVAGGFDDLLHDAIIAELKVERRKAVSVADCAKYLGQPVQYGVGCGSQLSILVVLDHSGKQAPPGVIENYVGWLKPALHGMDDPRYPSMVGVLIINSNPVPSTWSRSGHAVSTVPIAEPEPHR